jgi:transposase
MLTPNYDHEIPEMTVEVAKAAFPKGNLVMKIRDELGPLFEDQEFAELYPQIGQPSVSPACLALVTLLQFMENLTDREAADAVRGRIDWKYALGLELNDAGFNYSVLSEFRQRLLEHEAETYLLEKILDICEKAGLLTGKKQQRSDSTYVLGKVRDLNRLELVGETMRRALDEIARIAPEWLKPHIQAEWGKRYGQKMNTYRIRKQESKKLELAQTIGRDGQSLLSAIYQTATPAAIKQLASVEVLRRVWVQQYYQLDKEITWRIKKQQGLAPASKMVVSPDDLEVRSGKKQTKSWLGYKVHYTETCAEDAPRLITDVQTTVATIPDSVMTEKIQDDLSEKGATPETHLVDAGYVDAVGLETSQQKGIDLMGPPLPNPSWQAKIEGGYDASQFTIDWDEMVAICPQGKRTVYWKEETRTSGKTSIHFAFSDTACLACQARDRCTRAQKKGRQLRVPPQAAHQALQQARHRQETDAFWQLYRRRAGVEGTIDNAMNVKGARRARYTGLARTHFQQLMTATAINIERVTRWLLGERPKATYVSSFAALVSSG